MANHRFIELPALPKYSSEQLLERSRKFYADLKSRRTVRDFSDEVVPRSVIENCLLAAGTAPSGANLQPWHFSVVSNPQTKNRIRVEAEKEEHEFYHGKAPSEWLDALSALGTDENKPFLEIAPYLIVIFAQSHKPGADGNVQKHYYVSESVGIATGILITALHHCGLATLTHTPSPMRFLNEILDRPSYERPYLILVTGFAAKHAKVPDITKKRLDQFTTFVE